MFTCSTSWNMQIGKKNFPPTFQRMSWAIFFNFSDIERFVSDMDYRAQVTDPAWRIRFTAGVHHVWHIWGGCWIKERQLTSQSPLIILEFFVQYNLKITFILCRIVGIVVKDMLLAREVCGRFPGRSNRILSPTVCHGDNPVLSRRCAAGMGPASRYSPWRNSTSIIKISFWFFGKLRAIILVCTYCFERWFRNLMLLIFSFAKPVFIIWNGFVWHGVL